MRKVVLYIAMSLDGYIADRAGSVDWLNGHGGAEESADAYAAFIREVDDVVMGWNTYHQITTELSPSEWPYEGLMSHVITHRALRSTERVKFVRDEPCHVVEELRGKQGKAIWICGGGSVIQPLLEGGLIDEYRVSVIPTILGSGIRLFGQTTKEIKLKLVGTQTCGGIIELVYTRRQPLE